MTRAGPQVARGCALRTVAVDPTVARELSQFDGIRVSDVLLDDYWKYSGEFPAGSLERLRDLFPYRFFGLPPRDGDPDRSSSLSPAVDAECIQRYFAILGEVAPRYVELVDGLSAELPPMSQDCRLSLLIPAHHETLRLRPTLEQILVREKGQGPQLAQADAGGRAVDPGRYEVIVLGNQDESDPEPDDTVDIVEDFDRDFGHLGVAVFGLSVSFPALVSGCGAARKVLQDIALLRSLRRPAADRSLYLAVTDADVIAFPRATVSSYVRALDQNPAAPCATARGAMTPSDLDSAPLASLDHRIYLATAAITHSDAFGPGANRYFHATLNRWLLMGNTTVLRARSLAATGGFPVSARASDLVLDEQLAMYHGRFQRDRSVFSMSTEPHLRVPLSIVTSPRRLLMTHIRGGSQYHEGTFTSARHTRLTRQPDGALATLAREAPVDQGRAMVDRTLDKQVSQLCRTAPSAGDVADHVHRALRQVGLSDRDYRMTGGGRSCSVSLLPSAYPDT